MKITKKDYEKATVLSLKGKIKIGSGDVALREAIDRAVADGAKNVVLDFKGVSRIDSSGLGELVAAHKKLGSLGGNLSLMNMSGKLLDVVGASQIVSILDVFGSEEEALTSFE
ncbi:MAG: STAS domain-containing protein [Acidobacteria bacterium]|nr:STAS domain-containing protein [Acidobacteriota bacterium]